MNSELDDAIDIALRQLLIGLTFWSASSIALYVSLSSSGSSVLWYGGCIAALFNWYRFGKILTISKLVAFSFFRGARTVVFLVVTAVVGFSLFYIGPEAMRVSEPGVGTCWAETESNNFSPVACWSNESRYKTIAVAESESSCPSASEFIFPPDSNDPFYHCLESV